MLPTTKIYLGLDIGEKRVGLAVANSIARLPSPIGVIKRSPDFFDQLKAKINENQVDILVVGLPRNMSGEETAQTDYTRAFTEEIKKNIGLPIIFEDETLTSHKAQQELQGRNVVYNKGQIDALAAVYILEDFLKRQEYKDLLQNK